MPSLRRPSARRPALFWTAVLIALAVGLALGAGLLARVTGDGGLGDLRSRVDQLESDNARLQSRADSGDSFADATAGTLLADRLKDSPVLVVRGPDADDGDLTRVQGYIKRAGGTVSGTLSLTRALYADGESERLRGVTDQVVPTGTTLTGADPAARTGDLLGALLLTTPDRRAPAPGDRRDALAALRDGGFLTYAGDGVTPGRVALVVTGGGVNVAGAAEGQAIGRFSAALSTHGSGAVLAGRTGASDGGGPIPVVRQDVGLGKRLSTVDDVDTAVGRVTTVLSLAEAIKGRYGAYGSGKGATAAAPGA